jgi:hypothetical protein
MSYEVKIRDWWVDNPSWPNGLEPASIPWKNAYPLGVFDTEDEARECCQEYNATHKPGRLSRKAEYTEI